MSSADIQVLLEKEFPGSEITIAEGYHNEIEVVSETFEGVSAVKRQQMVYKPLTELITGGTVHAVKISALTPAEKKAQADKEE
jgi:acid stress-induced BolA-like protein IbaG/YrbA